VLALSGHGAPPEWYGVLQMAEAWGVAPWTIEAEAPALWADRFTALHNAKAKAAKPKAQPSSGKGKRLI
jgi:hypothetical protein